MLGRVLSAAALGTASQRRGKARGKPQGPACPQRRAEPGTRCGCKSPSQRRQLTCFPPTNPQGRQLRDKLWGKKGRISSGSRTVLFSGEGVLVAASPGAQRPQGSVDHWAGISVVGTAPQTLQAPPPSAEAGRAAQEVSTAAQQLGRSVPRPRQLPAWSAPSRLLHLTWTLSLLRRRPDRGPYPRFCFRLLCSFVAGCFP